MLHIDVKKGYKFFQYTSIGWMMWPWMISALGCGASALILYEGSPMFKFKNNQNILIYISIRFEVTILGVSARFLQIIRETWPQNFLNDMQNSKIRTLLSTGSPLDEATMTWASLNNKIQVASISGGTDILGLFFGACPILPVYAGQLQCPILGMDVGVLNENSKVILMRNMSNEEYLKVL